jgi:hypothetical protein
MSRRLLVADFDLRIWLPAGDEAEQATERLSAALSIIRTFSPTRYAYLRRDLPRIFIGATHNLAECHYPTGTCLLQTDFVLAERTIPEHIALALVHEGTHARLHRVGFRYDEPLRARIERLCVIAELIVARRLPDAAYLVSHITAQLPSHDSARWTNQALYERRLHALRERGVVGRLAASVVRAVTLARAKARRAA